MSEEAFTLELAGRRWALPHLPFRTIKAIQPALFQLYQDAGGEAATARSLASLGEAQIERLAEATWRAITHVEPGLSYDDFLALPFSVGDLIQGFPAVAHAAGLRAKPAQAAAEAAPAAGKSISTP